MLYSMKTMPHPTNPNDDLNLCRFHVSLDTTSHCNLRCRHCWMDAVRAKGYSFRNEVMPYELFTMIADEFEDRCKSFGISCGYEPLLNKEFDRYVAYAVRIGLPDVHFYTNGTLMTPEMAEKLVAAAPERIVFSLEGVDEESFQDIRRGATLAKFLGAIDMIAAARKSQGRARPTIRLNWVMMPRNIAQLPELAQLAVEHGVGEIFFIPHIRWAGADLQEPSLAAGDLVAAHAQLQNFNKWCADHGIVVLDEMLKAALPAAPGPKKAESGLRRLSSLLIRRPAVLAQLQQPYCLQPWEMMLVTSTGGIMPCSGVLLDRVYGDFRTQTLQEMWDSPAFRELRDGLTGRGAACGHCLECPHFRLNNKQEDFHRPRELDVERLRPVLPPIVPKRETPKTPA